AATLNLDGLAEAERVASSLAHFDVHDAEVRERLSKWLLRPLPASRLVGLGMDLAAVGLSNSVSPTLARHVRARARSSEVVTAVGAEVAGALHAAYE
ncbi:unnamed protein product, partial [Polarella glacialis]